MDKVEEVEKGKPVFSEGNLCIRVNSAQRAPFKGILAKYDL